MSRSNVELMQRWFEEVWNKGREDAIDEMLAAECHMEDLEETTLRCPEDFKRFHRKILDAMDTIRITLDHVIESGGEVAGIFTVNARHKATGKDVKFKSSFFGVIEKGKIVKAWNATDFLSLLIQTGALPKDCIDLGLKQATVV